MLRAKPRSRESGETWGTPATTTRNSAAAQSGTLSNGYTYIAAPDFTITASALSPATVTSGGSATSTITITPRNGFGGTLILSCTSIVPEVTSPPTCAFSPGSVTGSGTSMLAVRTTAANQGFLAPRSRPVFYVMWLPLGGLCTRAGLTTRRQKFLSYLVECVLFSGLIFLAACGGGTSSSGSGITGTPAGVYTVTISASKSVTQTTNVTLTVK
jgi:hypothetical protein